MLPRMRDLIDRKWAKYAQKLFVRRFLLFIVYLLLFAGVCGGLPPPPPRARAHLSLLRCLVGYTPTMCTAQPRSKLLSVSCERAAAASLAAYSPRAAPPGAVSPACGLERSPPGAAAQAMRVPSMHATML
jgi:hypothetical protein